MLLASVGHVNRAVALSQHDQAASVVLELVNIRIHTSGSGRSHRTTSHACRRLGRTGVVDRMVLQILRHRFACIQTCFNLRVGYITTDNNRAIQAQTGTNRIFCQDLAYVCHRLVEVDAYGVAFTCVAQFSRDERSGIVVHLLDPHTVLIDLALDIPVRRATYAEADRTRCTVARQTHYAHVMSQVLAAELCAEADLVRLLQQTFLQLDVAERTTGLVASGRQTVVEVRRGELDGQQVLLGRCATYNDGNMVRRTSGCAEGFHLFHKERDKRAFVLDSCFGLLIEVGLVRAAATLGYAQETVLHSFRCLQIDLCRQVALSVHLVVHRERSVLRVTQVALGVGIEHTAREGFLVAEARPNLLALLAMDDSRAGILAERQLAFGGHLSVAEERQSHVLVVGAGLGVTQDLGNLLVVRAAEHEAHVVERLLRHQRQCFGLNLEDGFTLKLADRHIVLGQQIVFRLVLAELEHRCILEFHIIR